MSPIAWMIGAGVMSWLVVTAIAGDQLNPEALFGMLAPLMGTCLSWMTVERTYKTAPERLTAVMITGFAVKLVCFIVYVAVMLRLVAVRPVPFVAMFVTYF